MYQHLIQLFIVYYTQFSSYATQSDELMVVNIIGNILWFKSSHKWFQLPQQTRTYHVTHKRMSSRVYSIAHVDKFGAIFVCTSPSLTPSLCECYINYMEIMLRYFAPFSAVLQARESSDMRRAEI